MQAQDLVGFQPQVFPGNPVVGRLADHLCVPSCRGTWGSRGSDGCPLKRSLHCSNVPGSSDSDLPPTPALHAVEHRVLVLELGHELVHALLGRSILAKLGCEEMFYFGIFGPSQPEVTHKHSLSRGEQPGPVNSSVPLVLDPWWHSGINYSKCQFNVKELS